MLTKKKPRDFVHIDEFWVADNHWPHYYFRNMVWVYADEYRAELCGDEAYSRIIITAGNDIGWLFTRALEEKCLVNSTLKAIKKPVSEDQLASLGFTRWKNSL